MTVDELVKGSGTGTGPAPGGWTSLGAAITSGPARRVVDEQPDGAPRGLRHVPVEVPALVAAHEEVEQARTEQTTDEWKQRYAVRAGVEGTIHQAVAATGVRRSRYTGLTKTRLAHVFAACEPHDKEALAQRLAGARVLLVEDNDGVRLATDLFLRFEGFHVESAPSAGGASRSPPCWARPARWRPCSRTNWATGP